MALAFALAFFMAAVEVFWTCVNWLLVMLNEAAALADSTGEPMTPTPTEAAARTAAAEARRAVRGMSVSFGGCVICTRPTGGPVTTHGPFVMDL